MCDVDIARTNRISRRGVWGHVTPMKIKKFKSSEIVCDAIFLVLYNKYVLSKLHRTYKITQLV